MIIKCVTCENDIELPTKQTRCPCCDTPVKKSQKLALKNFRSCRKQIGLLKKTNTKAAIQLKNEAAKQSKLIISKADADLKMLVANNASVNEFSKVNEAAKQEISTVFDNTNKQIITLSKTTAHKIAEIALQAGFDASKHQLDSNSEECSSDKVETSSPYRLKFLVNIYCIIVLIFGLLVTQAHLFLGMVLIFAGLLLLPFTHKLLSKKFTWLSYSNMRLMGYTVLTASIINLAMMYQ